MLINNEKENPNENQASYNYKPQEWLKWEIFGKPNIKESLQLKEFLHIAQGKGTRVEYFWQRTESYVNKYIVLPHDSAIPLLVLFFQM